MDIAQSYGRVIWLALTRQSVGEKKATERKLWISAQGPPGVLSTVCETVTASW